MKRKAVLFVLFLLATMICMVGCGGGGGHKNTSSSETASITGVVLNSDNKPVVGAEVKLLAQSDLLIDGLANDSKTSSLRMANSSASSAHPGIYLSTTDKAGRYSLTGIKSGNYSLVANGTGLVQTMTDLTVDGRNVMVRGSLTGGDINIALKPFGTVSGQITYADDNEAVENTIVYLEKTSYLSVTDANGNYTISGIPVDTDFIMHVSGAPETSKVKIPTDTRTLTQNIKITEEDIPGYKLTAKFNINDKNAVVNLTNLRVIALGSDGNCQMAVYDETSQSCEFTLFKSDTYKIFPILFGSEALNITFTENIGNPFIADVTRTMIDNGVTDEHIFEIVVGSSITNIYATLKGQLNVSEGNYEVYLISEQTGGNRKLFVSAANPKFEFSNITAGDYALVVTSEKELYIERFISLTANTVTEKNMITPVLVTPDYQVEPGKVTVAVGSLSAPDNFFVVKPDTVESDGLQITVIAVNDIEDETVLTEDSYLRQTFICPTDYLGDADSAKYYIKLRFAFQTGLPGGKDAIELFYENPEVTFTPEYRKISLNGITESDDIVFFQPIKDANTGETVYLVATSKELYAFDKEGTKIANRTLTQSPTGSDILGEVTQDNITYCYDGSIWIQFLNKNNDPDGYGRYEVWMAKYIYNFSNKSLENVYGPTSLTDSFGDNIYSYSANKLTEVEESPCALCSACDGQLFYIEVTAEIPNCSLNAIYNDSLGVESDYERWHHYRPGALASYTTILNIKGQTYTSLLTLGKDDENASQGTIRLTLSNPTGTPNRGAPEIQQTYKVDSISTNEISFNPNTDNNYRYCNMGYYSTYTSKESSYEFLDLNEFNGAPQAILKTTGDGYIVATPDSFASGLTTIKTSYLEDTNGTHYIERNASGECLKSQQDNGERAINIHQIINKEGHYLQNSVKALNDNSVNVICTDGNGTIQIMTLNILDIDGRGH